MNNLVFFVVAALAFGQMSMAEDCFSAKPVQNLTADMCGPVDASVSIEDCATKQVSKTFTATMGLDCLGTPMKLKLLYNKDKMLVGEVTQFGEDEDLILSKTYIQDQSRSPAQAKPQVEHGSTCFTMRPIEKINSQTCEPVKAQIQFLNCGSHHPMGERLEVTTHYSCGSKHQELKYWYKRMMLVGSLQKTEKGLKVTRTYTLIYPSIYGIYNDRTTSSVSTWH